jgi:hypothetical protein
MAESFFALAKDGGMNQMGGCRTRLPLTTTLSLGATLLLASVALTQSLTHKKKNLFENIDLPLNPNLFGIRAWKVGESSKYKVTLFHPNYLEVFHVTFSVVGEEVRDSKSLFWFETDVQPLNSLQDRVINKILRPFGNLTRFTEGAVGEILSQVGDNPPLAVPSSMLQTSPGSRPARDWAQLDLGQEEVQVTAGRFKTHKLRFLDSEENSADVWSTASVGPLGIVKAARNRWTLELMDHQSKGSVSAILGFPRLVPSRP